MHPGPLAFTAPLLTFEAVKENETLHMSHRRITIQEPMLRETIYP